MQHELCVNFVQFLPFFFSLSCVLFFLCVNKYQQLVQIKFDFICKTRTCLSKLMTFLNHLGSTCVMNSKLYNLKILLDKLTLE